MSSSVLTSLVIPNTTKIVLLVMDGLGDLPNAEHQWQTPLEAARTPNFDALAPSSALGRLLPVQPGVTPGSGPGHLGLFGYDPVETTVGRGVLEALGAGMELKPGDVAARANFCTLGADGIVTDRRADALLLKNGSPLSLQGRTAFFVLAGDHAVRRPVEMGVRGLDASEILSGLHEGDEVIISDMTIHQDAREVRVR